ncbi:hypothetical protein ECG_07769 [Echinococcus granulosus]|nr:hypothetical protein ECG_07769 [Echinococcus granulosus]
MNFLTEEGYINTHEYLGKKTQTMTKESKEKHFCQTSIGAPDQTNQEWRARLQQKLLRQMKCWQRMMRQIMKTANRYKNLCQKL